MKCWGKWCGHELDASQPDEFGQLFCGICEAWVYVDPPKALS